MEKLYRCPYDYWGALVLANLPGSPIRVNRRRSYDPDMSVTLNPKDPAQIEADLE